LVGWLVFGLVGASHTAQACSIPVFRYALERWIPDPYAVVVVHRGGLDEDAGGLVQQVREASSNETNPANLHVVMLNLDEVADMPDPAPEVQALAEKYADISSPQMVVHFPRYGPGPSPVWSGPLSAENIKRLIDSPVRQKIVKNLLSGDSAVWVLIPGGKEAADTKAESTLRRELARIEEELKLPAREVLEAETAFQPETAVELRIGFSVVRLSRDAADEEIFREMLLGSEEDLAELDEPIAVPIFGRGRTCFALVGDGINAEMIAENCYFICGDCSCQIKAQNPGVDMLMAVNWDAQILGMEMPDRPVPSLTGVGGLEILDLDELVKPDEPEASAGEEASTDTAEGLAAVSSPVVDAAVAGGSSTGLAQGPSDDAKPAAEDARGDLELPAADATRPFGRTMLTWLLGGVAVAAVIVVGASVWMKSRHSA
jgi:hypothetical protein